MVQTWNDNKLLSILIIILAIHCSVMLVNLRITADHKPEFIPRKDAIKIQFIPPTTQTAKTETTQTFKPKHQIVQSEDSENKTKPTTPAYLGEKDRTFDRETIARNVNKFNKAGKGDAKVSLKANEKTDQSKPDEAKKKPIQDLKLSDMGFAAADPLPKEVTRAPASESHEGIKNGDAFSKGMSATNDYVEEVALGDFTHMNTVEFKFYGFYHRIRQKLEQFWGKSIQEKAEAMFRAGRRMPASQNLITSLQVKLNAKGEIVGVKILGASGVKELDDAAIESFNQAGPFPNPPKDLLINDVATIEWGFVVNS
jgi:protein TonB